MNPCMKETPGDVVSRKVFLVGPNTLQNELLASTLQKELGLSCFVFGDLAQTRASLNRAEKGSCLALYDCLGKDRGTCLADLEGNGVDEYLMLALFNLDKTEGLERQLFHLGVRGFFYTGEPFSLFVRGVVGIFQGELWISRRLLSELVTHQAALSRSTRQHHLSGREKEILGFMVGGATEEEIADAMFISRHTVKNHLCNIFRKIRVHNKAQAAKWVAQYLET
jgi:DNA-binding NarL/FixJ family response regulator